ncbi:hypothetical protein HYH03_008972 [Edaphochlamys debaryana]|uniref:Uncharacterized protein n=1 Tax=Edaphochlamys debaryana TaxID=47281 RepID=A0A835XYW8_9CHLO|nr:hypothetical protein HYH03_008972 [Edaphochlamys debaryana]|eukprot:KAG2492813.1 hypothetical protein HYH03_008972 [Edaphochlamys debaryana]
MLRVLGFVDAPSLARAGLVCRQWRILHEHPRLWERACQEAFLHNGTVADRAALHKLITKQFRMNWKRMYVTHPHLRFDGLYASRNTYVRTGVAEFKRSSAPVHLVTYFRYYRFFPDGTFVYRTSPNILAKVVKSLLLCSREGQGLGPGTAAARVAADKGDGGKAMAGRYIVRSGPDKTHVLCLLRYPNSSGTELRCRLVLRSTVQGANNRLDIESITTYDRELGRDLAPAQDQEEDQDLGAAPPGAKAHSRGTAPCVFVPWEQVLSHPFNLPPETMDFIIL